jgi:hypothetical protein
MGTGHICKLLMMMFTFTQSDHIHVVPLLMVQHDMAPMK